jgi:exodeoxyribonuclease-5
VVELSNDQKNALIALSDWYKDSSDAYITLGGYAGTGKTTVIAYLRKILNTEHHKMKAAFCSYTGKAAQVLKNQLFQHSQLYKADFIGTIHSLIYKAVEDERGAIIGWKLREHGDVEYDLIVVDEASMIDSAVWQDLLSFRIPIVAVGDHGQLPPINGKFNLMEKPKLKLEQIHRQAHENPILRLSIMARESGSIPVGVYGLNVEKMEFSESGGIIEETLSCYDENTLFLCGYNSTRVKINAAIRSYLGFDTPFPGCGDRVICLRNNREKNIFNGMLGTLEDIKVNGGSKYKVRILMDSLDFDTYYEGEISSEQFNSTKTLNNLNGGIKIKGVDLFDFGYALTVHKAQGSQAKKVVLFEERFKKQDEDLWRRWLYTAVTRAEEELLIFG